MYHITIGRTRLGERLSPRIQDVEEQLWEDYEVTYRHVDSVVTAMSDEDTASECADYSDTDSAFE